MISSRTADKHRNHARAARRQRLPRQALPGSRAAAARRAIRRAERARIPQLAGDDRQVPGDPRDRQRRHQPRLPRARPVRRPRRRDQGAASSRSGADPETERMTHKAFVAEASLAGKLNHPHIVDIYDAVVEPDRSYLVMEYVPGGTLEAHADAGTLLPVGKVVEIIFKCIRALEYAHQHGVIHRDIKPGNILLSERRRDQGRRLRRLVPAAPRGPRPRRSRASARRPTCRPSRCAWRRSTSRPTSTRSASPCSACSPGACRSRPAAMPR